MKIKLCLLPFPGRFKPPPRPRKGGSVWHYRWLGRFRSIKARGLGRKLGRVTGLKKVFNCAMLAKRNGYKAFALRRRGICYGARSSRAYTSQPVIKGRFRAGAGGRRFIDAYIIGRGMSCLCQLSQVVEHLQFRTMQSVREGEGKDINTTPFSFICFHFFIS